MPFAVARGVPPSPWIDTIADGLPAARADSASICATTCSHPSATTSTAPTFGCWQYAASVSCVVCMSGPSWPQPCEMRQGHRTGHRGGDPFGHHGRTHDGRHDEDMIANAHASIWTTKSVEAGLLFT